MEDDDDHEKGDRCPGTNCICLVALVVHDADWVQSK